MSVGSTTTPSRGVLVHEWIEQHGGSEKVLDAMASTFPGIDMVCLWSNAPDRYVGHTVRQTWLAHTPIRRSKALAMPAMPLVWRHLPGGDYDWALVSSHAFAVQARFREQPVHHRKFVYTHTPARYVWTPELDERGSSRGVRAVAPFFRAIDRRRAKEAHAIAANSAYVRQRIARTWEREATIIHPPVDVECIQQVDCWADRLSDADRSQLDGLPDQFVLGVSRFIPYKRLDLVIRAGEAADVPVVLAGAGPDEALLRAQAERCSVPVHFIRQPSDELLYSLYERACLFVFPAVEDFGIVPVEAMASGTPVLSGDTGGVIESVVDDKTGVHVHDWNDTNLGDLVQRAADLDAEVCRIHARAFDVARFQDEIRCWIDRSL